MDKIIGILNRLGWSHVNDMVVKDCPDRPVYQRGEFKCVVGPLWTTHYRLVRDTISEQDSIKTDNVEKVEAKLTELTNPPVRGRSKR